MGVDSSNIRDLAADFSSVPLRASKAAAGEIEKAAKHGERAARTFARSSAGKHGKHYYKAITSEADDALGLAWVYGPDVSYPQGGMSFEFGSRNQPPHLDLNRSADLLPPLLARVADLMANEVLNE